MHGGMERGRAFLDVRRLAAVDMHGLKGSALRRRLIVAEFLGGAVVGVAIGIYLVLTAASAIGVVIGIYALGVAANYAVLSAHTFSLGKGTALAAELRGVDLRAELRHYTKTQFWVFVPFLFPWLSPRR